MLNILPPQEKKKYLTEYRLRALVVVLWMLVALVVVNLALLTPAYLGVFSKQAEADLRVVSFTGASSAENDAKEKAANARIVELNKKLGILVDISTSTQARIIPSEAFGKIISAKTAAIKIYSLAYTATTDREDFVVTGVAADRDSLAKFVETLKEGGAFASVELPINSYVKSTDIEFSLTLSRVLKSPTKKIK